MADVVIVVGARRGREPVPVAEIRQMTGRAGRKHGGSACEAYILVDGEDVGRIEEGLAGNDKFEVCSSLSSCEELVFHILPGICSGKIRDGGDAEKWFNRSFGAIQEKRPDIGKVLDMLLECGAIAVGETGIEATELGRISSELYFHPFEVKAWKDNFTELFELGLEKNDAAVAWAIGSVSTAEVCGDFGNHRYVFNMFREALPSELMAKQGTVANSVLWWSALGGPSVGKMRNRMLELRGDFGRIGRALGRLDKMEDWGMSEFFKELNARIKRGVPECLSELCKIPEMSKGLAEYLYNIGVKNRKDIRDSIENLVGDMDEKSALFLREVANGVR